MPRWRRGPFIASFRQPRPEGIDGGIRKRRRQLDDAAQLADVVRRDAELDRARQALTSACARTVRPTAASAAPRAVAAEVAEAQHLRTVEHRRRDRRVAGRAIEHRIAPALQLLRVERVGDALEIAARLGERIGEADARELDAITGTGERGQPFAAAVAAHGPRYRLAQIAFEHRHGTHNLRETILLPGERATRRAICASPPYAAAASAANTASATRSSISEKPRMRRFMGLSSLRQIR